MYLVRPTIKQLLWRSNNLIYISKNRSSTKKSAKVKIGPDLFEISVDVRAYAHHELKIKAHKDYVLIQGKQEREIEDGYVIRQFAQRFRLPKGCSPERMQSTLSPEGILTISASREYCDSDLPCETLIPIKLYEGSPEEAVSRKSRRYVDPCVLYKKNKIKPRTPEEYKAIIENKNKEEKPINAKTNPNQSDSKATPKNGGDESPKSK